MIKTFIELLNVIANIKNKLLKSISAIFNKYPLLLILLILIFFIYLYLRSDIFLASTYLGLLLTIISIYIFFYKIHKNKHYDELDPYERIISTAGVLSVSFLAVTIFMLNFGKFVIPSSLHIGSIDSWIQFSGSILGGTLTLFALAFTMNEQEKNREEDRKNELLPIIEVSLINRITENEIKNSIFRLNDVWTLKIENVSDNPLRNIKLIESKFYMGNSGKEIVILKNQFTDLDKSLPNIIPKNKTVLIELNLNIYEIADIKPNYYKFIYLEFDFEYYDVLIKNKHNHLSRYTLVLNQTYESFINFGYQHWTLSQSENNFVD